MPFGLRMGKYQFDRQVWTIFTAAVISSFGFGVVFPFLAIYLAAEMQLGETLTGIIMMSYMVTGTFFGIVAGAWADKFGRKKIMIISLAGEALLISLWAAMSNFWGFIAIALTEGAVGMMYMPAANAMMADLVPQNKRPQAYSLIRIAFNLGTVIGPLIGSVLIIGLGFRMMFVISGVVVACAAVLILFRTRETLGVKVTEKFSYSDMKKVVHDRPFLTLCILIGLTFFAFAQFFTTLPVYAYTQMGVTESMFAMLFAINAGMVVVLQIPATGQAIKLRRTTALTIGQGIICLAMFMIFFAPDYSWLIAATVVLTIGELFHAAIYGAVIADLAPVNLRGTYMGFSGVILGMGEGLGMLVGMSLMDILPVPNLTWVVIGAICVPATIGYLYLRRLIPESVDRGSSRLALDDSEISAQADAK